MKVFERVARQVVIRFETMPGLQVQVNWKEDAMRHTGGYRRRIYAFTMAAGFSRTPFVTHRTGMGQKTTLACPGPSLLQCVPREILYDSIRTASHLYPEGRWKANKYLVRMANHYDSLPLSGSPSPD